MTDVELIHQLLTYFDPVDTEEDHDLIRSLMVAAANRLESRPMHYANPIIGCIVKFTHADGHDTGIRGQVIDSYPGGRNGPDGRYWILVRITECPTQPDAVNVLRAIPVGDHMKDLVATVVSP